MGGYEDWYAMRWRRLLEPGGPPSIETAMRRIRDNDLYLCTRQFAIRFTHRSHMDRFYPYRTPDNVGTTSRLVIGTITTIHESLPRSELLLLYPCSTYSRHPIIIRTNPIELSLAQFLGWDLQIPAPGMSTPSTDRM